MHTVGADRGIGVGDMAVVEGEAHAVRRLVDASEPMVVFYSLWRYGARQRCMQVAAMGQEVRRAIGPLGVGAEQDIEQYLAVLPVAIVPRTRIESVGAQAVLEPQPAQHVHGVAADLDAGTEPRELFGLLVDRDLVADLAHSGGSGEPTHTGSDDRDVEFVCHTSRHSTPPAEPLSADGL